MYNVSLMFLSNFT